MNKLLVSAAFAAAVSFSAVAEAAPYTNDFNDPGDVATWTKDRFEPNGFESGVTFLGEEVLKLTLSTADNQANRPAGFNGIFYDTQGMSPGAGLPLDLGTRGAIDFYAMSEYQDQERRTGELWGVGVDGSDNIVSYPIIGLTTNGEDRWQGYDSSTGSWITLAGGGAVVFDAWYRMSYELDGTNWLYEVVNRDNPAQMWSGSASALGAIGTKNLIVQGYNQGPGGVDAVHHFDNLTHGAVPEPATWALLISGFGLAGSAIRGNRRKMARLAA